MKGEGTWTLFLIFMCALRDSDSQCWWHQQRQNLGPWSPSPALPPAANAAACCALTGLKISISPSNSIESSSPSLEQRVQRGFAVLVIHIYRSTLGVSSTTSSASTQRMHLPKAQPLPTWELIPGPVVMQECAGSDPAFHSLFCFVLL